MRSMTAVTTAVFILSVSTYCWAGERWYAKEGGANRKAHFEKMSKELNLTPEQKAQLEKQREQYREVSKETRKSMHELRMQLKDELDKPSPDKGRIDAIITQSKELIGREMQTKVDKVLATKKVLTPEQYANMRTIMEEKMKRHIDKKREDGCKGPDKE